MIDGYCLQGWLHEAKQVFIRWFRAVFNLTLINGYCKRMENRQRHRSCERNVSKTIKTWNCNIHQYCIAGIISSREILPCTKMYDWVACLGFKPNTHNHTYCIMLDGLCKNGHAEEALVFLQELERKNVGLSCSCMMLLLLDCAKKASSIFLKIYSIIVFWWFTCQREVIQNNDKWPMPGGFARRSKRFDEENGTKWSFTQKFLFVILFCKDFLKGISYMRYFHLCRKWLIRVSLLMHIHFSCW